MFDIQASLVDHIFSVWIAVCCTHPTHTEREREMWAQRKMNMRKMQEKRRSGEGTEQRSVREKECRISLKVNIIVCY